MVKKILDGVPQIIRLHEINVLFVPHTAYSEQLQDSGNEIRSDLLVSRPLTSRLWMQNFRIGTIGE